MELRRYWRIFRRRWWVAGLLTLAVAATSLAVGTKTEPSYVASGRFLVSVAPETKSGSYYSYDRYYGWISAEYLTDDLAEVLNSRAFAEDVRAQLGDEAPAVGFIQGGIQTEKTHRLVRFTVVAGDAAQAQAIAEAAAQVVAEKGNEYFAQLGQERAMVRLIDPPVVAQQGSGTRRYLDVGLRTGLGLFAGIALVFLLHYLDTVIYEAKEVEDLLRVPVLGEIPRES